MTTSINRTNFMTFKLSGKSRYSIEEVRQFLDEAQVDHGFSASDEIRINVSPWLGIGATEATLSIYKDLNDH